MIVAPGTARLARPKVLSQEQVEHFLERGWVVLEEAFPRDLAPRLEPLFWQHLQERRDDPGTWRQEGVLIKVNIGDEPAPQVVTERYQRAVDDLCGAGRARLDRRLGYAPVRFPGFSSWPWRATGWHVDGINFRHHVDSREQGLVGLDLITDIDPGGGGTAVRPGSHRVVSRLLASEPGGIEPLELNRRAEEATRHLPSVEVCGRAGDAVLMHPHLVHGSSTNLSRRVRIAANRCIGLRESMQLVRDDPSQYSLVEHAIRLALADEG